MKQQDLRTYRRREVTRESGYHTCENTTGGECRIVMPEQYIFKNDTEIFKFKRSSIDIVELFTKGITIVAFGGYVRSNEKILISLEINYSYENEIYNQKYEKRIEANTWHGIGIHREQIINRDSELKDVIVEMKISSKIGNHIDFIAFDFDVISKDEFLDVTFSNNFYQKTEMHIPHIYYLKTDLSIKEYLYSDLNFIDTGYIVMKSCNRCGRFLPINIDDELKTSAFSLHCKKNAPCTHSTFSCYTIENSNDISQDSRNNLKIENDKLISYYGHQLECKACKKFFVNAPLNPQRNPQQFKEDGLRRRALEVLVNFLLDKNLIHFEFEKKTKKEFSKFIWQKFGKKCFKCGVDSSPIDLKDMALDHTMPLAYLYRLDETATCLCSSHNSQKSDHFPVDYYSEEELVRLSSITGLSIDILHSKEVNKEVLDLLVQNIVWFYDEFLMKDEYQKIRAGIKTADKINDSLKRVISGKVDLAEEYKNLKGEYPKSITIK